MTDQHRLITPQVAGAAPTKAERSGTAKRPVWLEWSTPEREEGMRGEREKDLDCEQLSCHLRMLVVPREVGRLE